MDRRLGTLGLVGLVVALSGAAAPAADRTDPPDPRIASGAAQRELDAARERWRREGASDYHYDAALNCFCAPDVRAPVRITVRDNRPGTVPEHLRPVATVPAAFALIQEAIDDRVAGLSVEYGDRGVPGSVWIDRSARIADEERGYRIEAFVVDTRGARGDVSVRLRWEGPRGDATRLVVCEDGVLRRGWPDRRVCGRLLADEDLRRPITIETKDLRRTEDPQLFTATGRIGGASLDFAWRGAGSSTRLNRLREWEAALGPAAIERVRGG